MYEYDVEGTWEYEQYQYQQEEEDRIRKERANIKKTFRGIMLITMIPISIMAEQFMMQDIPSTLKGGDYLVAISTVNQLNRMQDNDNSGGTTYEERMKFFRELDKKMRVQKALNQF